MQPHTAYRYIGRSTTQSWSASPPPENKAELFLSGQHKEALRKSLRRAYAVYLRLRRNCRVGCLSASEAQVGVQFLHPGKDGILKSGNRGLP